MVMVVVLADLAVDDKRSFPNLKALFDAGKCTFVKN